MCIGLPMQVVAVNPGSAVCRDRHGQERLIDTALVDTCTVGDWLLIFLDAAREHLDAQRAAEIDSTLAMLEAALYGTPPAPDSAPGFSLPSAMNAEQLATLLGQMPPVAAPTRPNFKEPT